jgi:xanthine dehydrogenase small subunit
MITFILNNEKISTGSAAGSSLLDFIRYEIGLSGTKIGCREGDCGACTVLMGSVENGTVSYKSIVSCLTPLVNAHGKHIVTVEGINTGHLSPVQKALVDNSATQCGFCTPGIVMSLTAYSLADIKASAETAIASVSGNICRCTGYKSIEKAAEAISGILKNKNASDPVRWLVEQKHLPDYFLTIAERLAEILNAEPPSADKGIRIAGGTDLMVQKAEELAGTDIVSFQDRKDLKGINILSGRCIIGAAVTMSEVEHSAALRKFLPELPSYMKHIASEPVRNMATLAGNIVNASPIGDMSVMLLALNAEVTIEGAGQVRSVPLKDFFLGYKKTDLAAGEFISSISFDYKPEPAIFSFEKVSKRTHLDIASVNSAMRLTMKGQNIGECHLSAGGVSPVPLFLRKTGEFFAGKPVTLEILLQANTVMQEEISPISDVRGSAEYKRLLLRQLLIAHFLRLFPERLNISIDTL